MWYVVQVLTGQEHKMLEKIERIADSDTYERCAIPMREQSRKTGGEWTIVEEILFPGYLFVKTKTPEAFASELRGIAGTVRLLSSQGESGEHLFVPLSSDETLLVFNLTGSMESTVRMSTGVIEGDTVRVLAGPLFGREGLIKKVNRHKRIAYLGMEMCGRTVNVKVGLEIVRRS